MSTHEWTGLNVSISCYIYYPTSPIDVNRSQLLEDYSNALSSFAALWLLLPTQHSGMGKFQRILVQVVECQSSKQWTYEQKDLGYGK